MTLFLQQWADLQAGTTSSTSTTAATQTTTPFFVVLELAVALGAIFIFGTIFTRLLRRLAMRAGAHRSVVRSADQWVLVLMLVAAVVAVGSITGLSSQLSTLTLSGIGGLAVTLALQSTLTNIIAGVLMLRDGVIRLGDDIEFGQIRGEIVRISLRTTWVKRPDGSLTIIGNNNLSAGPMVNYSAKARLENKLQV